MKRHFSFLLLLLFAAQAHAQIYYSEPYATGTGSSWFDPGDLETLLTNAPDGSQVWVKQGLYDISNTIVITHSISIYGGFEGTENNPSERSLITHNYSILHAPSQIMIGSILSVNVDPYNGIHPVIQNISHFELDGFYLENAFTGSWGGALRVESVDNLVLRNIVVRFCQAYDGGGMYLENIPLGYMENVMFWENYASCYGGGLFVSDCENFIMVNTAFNGNYAGCSNSPVPPHLKETYGSSGLFFEQSKIDVHFMTLTQNSFGKGGYVARSTVHFNNVISYPDSINIEYNHNDTVYYDHCCLWTTDHLRLQGLVYMPYLGDWTNMIVDWDVHNTVIETNIISSNPLYDLNTYFPYPYLQSGSPCIDAGSGTYGIPYDLFGLQRPSGTNMDIGAMEYQQ